MRFPLELPPVMQRLHEALEYYDEYQRPVRGFFMSELDHNSSAPERHPVLVYIQPTSLQAPKADTKLPPDWIGEVLFAADAPSRLEKYARHGVREYWRLIAPPDGALRLEVHTDVEPEAGRYATLRVFAEDETVESAAFPGLQLKPGDLRAEGPLVPPEPPGSAD